jgi:predicted RNA-binding protein associated with RNAse of E/G family
VNQPGDAITVRKLDTDGREVWRWQAVVRRADDASLQVEARFNAADQDLHGLSLRGGDRFVETYFSDRWYNVFEVRDGYTGAFKGWYCNVSRPARWSDGEVSWVDLGLDVIVFPDRSSAVLDEDEFAALHLAPGEADTAQRAAAELVRHARDRSGPFARSPDERTDPG